MSDIVEVVAYDAEWPKLFEIESKLIKNALGKPDGHEGDSQDIEVGKSL